MNSEEDVLDAIAAVQDGEYEAVRLSLSQRLVSVNVKDKDNCTLLHWAAINNRVHIAKMLIEFGAEHHQGGVLRETPLQWAMRKKYYEMMVLLIEKLHVDLRERSSLGLDALHLACRLDDPNVVFLLLANGAITSSRDNDGNTPLLYLVHHFFSKESKERDPAKISRAAEMIRLLLSFGADAASKEESTSQNSALHVLAMNPKADLSIALILYKSDPLQLPNIKNSEDRTPYGLAVLQENRAMSGFLFDALMLYTLPFHAPTVSTAALVLLLVALLEHWSVISALVGITVAYLVLSSTVMQLKIEDYKPRISVGVFLGGFLSLIWSFLFVISRRTSVFYNAVAWCFIAGTLYFVVKIIRSPAQCAKIESRSDLVKRIVLSSPSEGTDEENNSKNPAAIDNNATGEHDIENAPQNKIVKDSFTGKIQVVRSNSKSQLNDGVALAKTGKRCVGPKLCGTCLCDKRAFTASGLISLATHCAYCGVCVQDQDHHSLFFGKCVGRGNRREFFFFLVCAAMSNALYFCAAKYIQYYELLPPVKPQNIISRIISCEWTLFTRYPHFFLQVWIFAAFSGIMLAFMAQGQLLFVSRETTLTNVVKNRYMPDQTPPKKQMKNIMTFLRTGQYTVLYSKLSERKAVQKPCCAHDHCKSESKPSDSQKEVNSLFSRIEKEMGGDSSIPAASSLNWSLADTVKKSTNSIHGVSDAGKTVDDPRPRPAKPEQPPLASHHYNDGGSDGDGWDDFDSEFAESTFNNYERRYDDDDDDDDDTVNGGELARNNAFYNHQDDEEALLKSRNQ